MVEVALSDDLGVITSLLLVCCLRVPIFVLMADVRPSVADRVSRESFMIYFGIDVLIFARIQMGDMIDGSM